MLGCRASIHTANTSALSSSNVPLIWISTAVSAFCCAQACSAPLHEAPLWPPQPLLDRTQVLAHQAPHHVLQHRRPQLFMRLLHCGTQRFCSRQQLSWLCFLCFFANVLKLLVVSGPCISSCSADIAQACCGSACRTVCTLDAAGAAWKLQAHMSRHHLQVCLDLLQRWILKAAAMQVVQLVCCCAHSLVH